MLKIGIRSRSQGPHAALCRPVLKLLSDTFRVAAWSLLGRAERKSRMTGNFRDLRPAVSHRARVPQITHHLPCRTPDFERAFKAS